ncbi:hypothetical protein BDV98DRAFT_574129 [Pterulicium gracile]|uniref:Uncharacterized protein n=1 Tax=Pterulicium gracile TaxID=1884261 RepID=A0A5C3Q837_9AGAR|nr:hypothetical protein BDV98DRAFT_574129 [Pterula gracilis]
MFRPDADSGPSGGYPHAGSSKTSRPQLMKDCVWWNLLFYLSQRFKGRLPPRYCLGIPFLDDLELYECASALPWKQNFPNSLGSFDDVFMFKDDSETLAMHIGMFFLTALPSGRFYLKLDYCSMNGRGDRADLIRFPVLTIADNHERREEGSENAIRQCLTEVMEKYLLRTDLWENRRTHWILAYDTIFDMHGQPRRDNMCPMYLCVYPQPSTILFNLL